MLISVPTLIDQTHLVLSTGGRLVITIAAVLFVAYMVLMTTALLGSMVVGWIRSALHHGERFVIAADQQSMRAMVEQS